MAVAGDAQFLGREQDLAALVVAFERAKGGKCQVVCIAGDAGIGKSRLLRELRHELTLRSEAVTWLEGRCSAQGQAVPLLPLAQQVRERLAIADTDGTDEVLAKIDNGLEPYPKLAGLAPYLRTLLSVEVADHDVEHMDSVLRRAQVFEALRTWTASAIARPPLILVFEDLHWADRSTEEFLATAQEALLRAPVLIIATHRTGYEAPFSSSPPCTRLNLAPLSADDAAALGAQVLGVAELPRDVRAALAHNANGVPLCIEELSKALLAAGVLQRQGSSYLVARPLAEADISPTLEGIISARLDRLRDGAKRAIQLCAVLGLRVSKRLLERVAESPVQLDGWLDELDRQDVLERPGRSGDAYVFPHAVIQDVAYHSLAPARRRELHRAAAAAIEDLAGDRVPEYCAELARHWEGAEQWAKAMEYAQRAGDQAALLDAADEARQQYVRAVGAAQRVQPAPEPRQLAALLSSCAAAQAVLGEYDEGVANYTRALALAREAGDRNGELDVLLGMADLHDTAHHPDELQVCCDQAFALAGELGDRTAQALCLLGRAASITAWQGPTAEARRAAKAALELADQLTDSVLRARALITLGGVLEWRTDLDSCQRYLQEGTTLAERAQCGRILGDALFHLGHAYLSRGRYEQALRWYDELRGFAERTNDELWIARTPSAVAGVYSELFDADRAVQICMEADELAQRAPSWPALRAHAVVELGIAHLQRREYDAADAALRRAWDLLEGDGWMRWSWHIPLLRARAELAYATNHLDEALSFATQARQLATQTDSRKQLTHVQVVLGQIAAAQDQLPEAAQLLRSTLTMAEHLHATRELWLAASGLAGVLSRLGHEREAETYLTQAAQTIEAIAGELGDARLRAAFTSAEPVADVYRRLGRRPLPASAGAARVASAGALRSGGD